MKPSDALLICMGQRQHSRWRPRWLPKVGKSMLNNIKHILIPVKPDLYELYHKQIIIYFPSIMITYSTQNQNGVQNGCQRNTLSPFSPGSASPIALNTIGMTL